MNKKILLSIILFTIVNALNTTLLPTTNANINSQNITIIQNKDISRWDMFNFFANYYKWQIPESYKYIKVNFRDVKKWSILEASLQKLIYLNLINNPNRLLNQEEEISAWWFYRLAEKTLKIKIVDNETKKDLLNRKANLSDLYIIKKFIWNDSVSFDATTINAKIKEKQAIFNDVYKTLIYKHYDKATLDKLEMLNDAIQWLAKWTNDKHTVYFPPVKSKSFHDALTWEYEWIGSYVDMEKPGILKITSPIPGSPSERAWLKWWDIVTKVDWKEITKENSLNEVVSWIKWPAWTNVILTISRKGKILEITVKREKIILNYIESKQLDSRTYYIRIKSFWEHVSSDFKKSIEVLNKNNRYKKIIIDLRNDWGWYLDQVTDILSYFVPKWEKTAVVKYHTNNKEYISKGYDYVDFSKYKIVILQNSWTASASEILIWTLKDYYKDITIIWEQSYWKGSVQVMKNYSDWSLLKYTIAKWFTWKTETWIDGIWITPTIKLDFDFERFKNNWKDNQLEKARYIR